MGRLAHERCVRCPNVGSLRRTLHRTAAVYGYVWHHPANEGNRLTQAARATAFRREPVLGDRRGLGSGSARLCRSAPTIPRWSRTSSSPMAGWPEMLAWARHLREGDLFVDVGAHCGTYSLWACDLGALAIAVEPSGEAVQRLRRNVVLNNARVEIHQVALGDEKADDYLMLDAGKPVRLKGSPTTTFDDLVGGRVAAGVKIDVEGAELLVLGGRRGERSKAAVSGSCNWSGTGSANGFSAERQSDVLELLPTTGTPQPGRTGGAGWFWTRHRPSVPTSSPSPREEPVSDWRTGRGAPIVVVQHAGRPELPAPLRPAPVDMAPLWTVRDCSSIGHLVFGELIPSAVLVPAATVRLRSARSQMTAPDHAAPTLPRRRSALHRRSASGGTSVTITLARSRRPRPRRSAAQAWAAPRPPRQRAALTAAIAWRRTALGQSMASWTHVALGAGAPRRPVAADHVYAGGRPSRARRGLVGADDATTPERGSGPPLAHTGRNSRHSAGRCRTPRPHRRCCAALRSTSPGRPCRRDRPPVRTTALGRVPVHDPSRPARHPDEGIPKRRDDLAQPRLGWHVTAVDESQDLA